MTPLHLSIINPSQHHNSSTTFHAFPRLPAELRLTIWLWVLQKNRLVSIEVNLDLPSGFSGHHLYTTTNTLNKIISGQNYSATIRGLQLYSKLLRVSREARKAALRFYRVHFPCRLQLSEDTCTQAIFYFNPECDFMHLKMCGSVERGFIDFLHDLKALDPRDIGLLNVALDLNGMCSGLNCITEIPEELARRSFITTLSQLQEIIWVAESHSGRSIMEPIDDFRGAGIRFNHSMPIKGIIPSFHILSSDPRPVGLELQYVLTGATDPRKMRADWQQLLKRWFICQAQPAKERVLFTYSPPLYEGQIHNIDTAENYLIEEHEQWLDAQYYHRRLIMRFAGRVPVEGPEELANAVRPAVGFWLFPAEALGPLEGILWHSKKVFDMTNYWPELALFDIS